MNLHTPAHWADYELIDSGNGEKLERFGKYVLIRPEPQALWQPSLATGEWESAAHARFVRDSAKSRQRTGANDGWKSTAKMPPSWTIGYQSHTLHLQFKLAFTTFGHVGIFPEQANNWEYMAKNIKNWKSGSKVLNLFAYTGGASLVARAMGCEVAHVDAVRNMITWAGENQQLSRLDGIRWVVEDALKFATREAQRGRKYQGILLDPPAYGRGPDGEKWVLEEGLPLLLLQCAKLLESTQSLVILNLYSMGLSPRVAANLLTSHFGERDVEYGELAVDSRSGLALPLGSFARFCRQAK
ncbi:MAG: class I SAM-dependent methyltransferase [Bacteroidetes bacterium]|jgi:23S rRNA (cytosine1962-C5)-methyltransferase|nr:class I SAM-dependent methyltransferase [Bacteroidota bacterium]